MTVEIEIVPPTEAEINAGIERSLVFEDRNCLSWWFPKLLEAGLPVPKTRIVRIPTVSVYQDLCRPLDGKDFEGPALRWLAVLQLAAEEIGYPCFLRTGLTSAKHEWRDTCHLPNAESLAKHVLTLIEYSECASLFGLDWNVWAVRELLPTRPVATVYQGMPLCREFRCFVDGDELLCRHSYWPQDVIAAGMEGADPDDFVELINSLDETTSRERAEIENLARAAGKACGGRWSVDILDTARGWYVTDMAEMDRSWHWPGCKNAPKNSA